MTEGAVPPPAPPTEPTQAVPPPPKRGWLQGCLGALVGFFGALPVLLLLGYLGIQVFGRDNSTKMLLPFLGFAAAVVAVVALARWHRTGFTTGLLIGAATVSLLFGICSGL